MCYPQKYLGNTRIFKGNLRQNPKLATIEIAEKHYENLLWHVPKFFVGIPKYKTYANSY